MMDNTTTNDPKTRKDVQRLEDFLERIRSDIEDKAAEEERLIRELAELRAEGQDDSDEADAHREDLRDVRDLLTELRETVPIVEAKLSTVREEAARGEAEQAIQRLRKRAGGIVGQHDRDVERYRALVAELGGLRSRIRTSRARTSGLAVEAEALAERYNLDAGTVKVVPEVGATVAALDAETRALVEPSETLPPGPERRRAERTPTGPDLLGAELDATTKAVAAARALRTFGEESAALPVLELAGDDVEWSSERAREAAKAATETKKARKLEEAVEAATEALEPLVASGPAYIPTVMGELRGQRFASGIQGTSEDRVVAMAADRLGLQRGRDDSGNVFWIPAGIDLGGLEPVGRFG